MITGKAFVYDETHPVEIIRNGKKISVPFFDISKGDKFYPPVDIGREPYLITVSVSAHYSGNSDYVRCLFCDENGSEWYPEDFGATVKSAMLYIDNGTVNRLRSKFDIHDDGDLLNAIRTVIDTFTKN